MRQIDGQHRRNIPTSQEVRPGRRLSSGSSDDTSRSSTLPWHSRRIWSEHATDWNALQELGVNPGIWREWAPSFQTRKKWTINIYKTCKWFGGHKCQKGYIPHPQQPHPPQDLESMLSRPTFLQFSKVPHLTCKQDSYKLSCSFLQHFSRFFT